MGSSSLLVIAFLLTSTGPLPADMTGVAVDRPTVLSSSLYFTSLSTPMLDYCPESDNPDEDFIRHSNDSAIVSERQKFLWEVKSTVQKPRLIYGTSRTSDFVHGTIAWLRKSTGLY